MAKRKYFITKEITNNIIQRYGGGHRYTLSEELSERGIIVYRQKTNPKRWLSINQKWDANVQGEAEVPYIMVHLTDSTGKIIRKDRYDYVDTGKKHIGFAYTEENGRCYDTFRSVEESIVRAVKQRKNQKACKEMKL